MNKEKNELNRLVDTVLFDEQLFKIFISDNEYIMGAVFAEPNADSFFTYKTIYDTILDIDEKIKKSFKLAIEWEYGPKTYKFNMALPPCKEDKEAIYYTENAIFRTSVLWDLLAQLYNIKFDKKVDPEKIYYTILFHNDSQGNHPNKFAKKVYSYLSEEEDESPVYDDEEWKGNHQYVCKYRNKMTHRNSPNVTSMSNYDMEFRMPMSYVLKRSIEDYVKASKFIMEIISMIITDLDDEMPKQDC